MPKPNVPMSARHPLGPRVAVEVSAELITTAVRNHSSHCMIAEAIKVAVPDATRIAVDISTCRFSDLSQGLRYVYLTPRIAQEALIDFDEGINPKPFSFVLKKAQVTRAATKRANRAKTTGKAPGDKVPKRSVLVKTKESMHPRVVGGRRPPQLHVRREFGLRAFRAASLNRLKSEQAVEPLAAVEGNEDDE